MKIFCVLNNYSGESDEIDWYLLPDSGILRHDNPMFVPEFDSEFRGYPSLIVKIDKLGKNVSAKFAGRYYSEVAPGVAVQASGLLKTLSGSGKPWTRAVVFDKCCFVGEFKPVEEWNSSGAFEIRYGSRSICWNRQQLRKGIDKVIEAVSRENIIKTGDLILVGLSPEYFVLERGKTVSAFVEGEERLQIRLK